MVKYTEKDSSAPVMVVEDNILRMSAFVKGDQFYVPKKPTWLVNPSDRNRYARARVLVVELLENNGKVVKPIYYSQLCRVDRKTKSLVIDDLVNRTIYKGGNKAFNASFGGKILAIKEVRDDVNDYAYDDNGNRLKDENGNTLYNPTKAYSFEVKNADSINDDEIKKLIDEYMKENFNMSDDEE